MKCRRLVAGPLVKFLRQQSLSDKLYNKVQPAGWCCIGRNGRFHTVRPHVQTSDSLIKHLAERLSTRKVLKVHFSSEQRAAAAIMIIIIIIIPCTNYHQVIVVARADRQRQRI